ncbi:MAG: zinc-binding dehydrogenase [Alphaproteobacteria bacterium]|nr:zinc-binding dehydrogenase [Alphaproteobacteria bacterium]
MSGNRQIVSTATAKGELVLSIIENDMPTPNDDEVVVEMEAAPINPSDMFPLLGFADYSKGKLVTEGNEQKMIAPVPEQFVDAMRARLDQTLPVGNEGAGRVIAAGANAKHLEGKLVSLVTGQCYQQFVKAPAFMCLPHKDDTTANEAASSYVNPLTALGFIETLKAEGHKAMVHTAAASNLGQMVLKLCQQEGIDIICVIRSDEQAKILKDLGAKYIVDSTADDFNAQLVDAMADTEATLGFDAIGAGDMADTLLSSMERALSRNASGLNTYGSDQHKQVYIYGRLAQGAVTLGQSYGMHWGLGGWLLTPFLQKAGLEKLAEMQTRVADEIKTTFASHITDELTLSEAIDPENIARYMPKKTGEKYLIKPQKGQ